MAEHLNGEQGATDGPNECVNGVPGGIDPGNLVGEKFEEIENTGERHDPRLAKDFERLVIRRENDPVLIDRETGDKDGEVKVNSGETGQTERNAQKVESFHAEISGARRDCHAGFHRPGRSELTADGADVTDKRRDDAAFVKEVGRNHMVGKHVSL